MVGETGFEPATPWSRTIHWGKRTRAVKGMFLNRNASICCIQWRFGGPSRYVPLDAITPTSYLRSLAGNGSRVPVIAGIGEPRGGWTASRGPGHTDRRRSPWWPPRLAPPLRSHRRRSRSCRQASIATVPLLPAPASNNTWNPCLSVERHLTASRRGSPSVAGRRSRNPTTSRSRSAPPVAAHEGGEGHRSDSPPCSRAAGARPKPRPPTDLDGDVRPSTTSCLPRPQAPRAGPNGSSTSTSSHDGAMPIKMVTPDESVAS